MRSSISPMEPVGSGGSFSGIKNFRFVSAMIQSPPNQLVSESHTLLDAFNNDSQKLPRLSREIQRQVGDLTVFAVAALGEAEGVGRVVFGYVAFEGRS